MSNEKDISIGLLLGVGLGVVVTLLISILIFSASDLVPQSEGVYYKVHNNNIYTYTLQIDNKGDK